MNQQILRKQTQDGKIILPKKDIIGTTLEWMLVAVATITVTIIWHYGGPMWGIPATILGCALVWKEGPR